MSELNREPNYFAESAQEFAKMLNDIIIMHTRDYIQNDTRANRNRLEFFKITAYTVDRNTKRVVVTMHIHDDKKGGVGDLVSQATVDIANYEFEKFVNNYKIAQVNTNESISDKIVNYDINIFQGSFAAFN